MTTRFPCPYCGGVMLIEKVHEGFDVPCPHCGAKSPIAVGTVPDPAPEGPADAGAVLRSVPPPRRPASDADSSLPLVFGILGLCGTLLVPCFTICAVPLAVFAPAAIWLGHRARVAARAEGRAVPGPAQAGFVLGIIGTAAIVFGLLAVAVIAVVAAAS